MCFALKSIKNENLLKSLKNLNMFHKTTSIIIISLIFLFIACDKPIENPDDIYKYNVLVLNEGLWNMNNSSITAYHTETKKQSSDVFKVKNGRSLGDVANDMVLSGSKVYIAVNMSGLIEVMDVYTGKSIRQISLRNEEGINRQPRCLSRYKNKIYCCCFDGSVVSIDTATLKVDRIVYAGANPDGICVSNNKLYVSNSGGLNYPNYGNTVSVFDVSTLKVLKTINVGTNPTLIKDDAYGDVYVLLKGNYNEIQSCLQRIDVSIDTVVQTFSFQLSNFDIAGDLLYFYNYDYSNKAVNFQVLNVKTEAIVNESFLKDNVSIKIPYSINVNPNDESVIISDALDYQSIGDVYCFDKNGKLTYSFEAGICPKKTIFINK